MTLPIQATKLESKRKSLIKSRSARDRHLYFHNIAETRYVLRKVFRLVEAEAKIEGIDSLAHQALIQIYGSNAGSISIRELAERLDISAPFASSIGKLLLKGGYVRRHSSKKDQRVVLIAITKEGKDLLHRIDENVRIHIDYFTQQLTQDQREAVVSVLVHYVGLSLAASGPKTRSRPVTPNSRQRSEA